MPTLSPPIPTHAPAVRRTDPLFGQFGGVGGEAIAPAPIVLWYFGPSAPKDLYNPVRDSVGWMWDGAGRFWEVFAPGADTPFGGIVTTTGFPNAVAGENGYLFSPRISGPVSSSSILDQIADFVEHTILPVALDILAIVQPEIGIAAAIVYKDVVQIAAGAKLTDALVSAIADAAKAKIPSLAGKELFDTGMSVALDVSAVKAERAKLDASVTGAVAETLGLKQALETGIAVAQTQAIQKKAMEILGSELGASGPLPWMAPDWNADSSPAADGRNNIRGAFRFAVDEGASPTDIAAAFFPTSAIGLARLSNALGTATAEIVPSASKTVKMVAVPLPPRLAASGSAVGKSTQSLESTIADIRSGKIKVKAKSGGGGGGGGGSGILLLGAAAVVGFLFLKGRR